MIDRDHPAVEALARELAFLDDGDPWPSNEELGGSPTGTRDDEFRAAQEETAVEHIGVVLPHLTADDLPVHLVRDIQARTLRATARAATYEQDGIPWGHGWYRDTLTAWLDELADNIEGEKDRA